MVKLYPTPGRDFYPWPAVEFDATPEEAKMLLGMDLPAFSKDPPPAPPPAPKEKPPTPVASAAPGGSTEPTEVTP